MMKRTIGMGDGELEVLSLQEAVSSKQHAGASGTVPSVYLVHYQTVWIDCSMTEGVSRDRAGRSHAGKLKCRPRRHR